MVILIIGILSRISYKVCSISLILIGNTFFTGICIFFIQAEKKSKASASKKAPSKNTSSGSGGKFTSKEYIEDDSSSSDSDKEKSKKKEKKDTKEVSLTFTLK